MIYDAATIGVADNQVLLNNYTATPVFRVTSRAPQRKDIRELDIPLPFENGISDFRTLIGETVYVIDGTMYPGSVAEYDSGLRALRKLASLDISQDDLLSDDGYVPYEYTDEQGDKTIFVKVLYVQAVESTRGGLVQPFRLVCKVKDPTIFGEEVTITSPVSDTTGAVGSAVYSFTYPIVYGSYSTTTSTDAENAGDLPIYPQRVTVHGPVTTPRVLNVDTGEYIEVAGASLAADSNTLVIQYDKDTLLVELDGNSVIGSVTSDSTYFKLQPGHNEIQLSGGSIGDGAYVEVVYRSGWPL